MKNRYFKIALLLLGLMGCFSIILFLVPGNNTPFIEFIYGVILVLSPPILYVSGIIYLINSMIKKETTIIVPIIVGVLATIIFLVFYVFSAFAILIGLK